LTDGLAELEPMPTRVRVGTWVTARARLQAEASDVTVRVLPPEGRPMSLLHSRRGDTVFARFNVDRAGAWYFQMSATLRSGARPVLETVLFAGVDPSPLGKRPAPGEGAGHGFDDASALTAMLNAARSGEGLGPLRADEALSAAAQSHAEAMRNSGRLAHDLGSGGPRVRLETRGVMLSIVDENIVRARSSVRAHRALWASPSHRDNLLRHELLQVGVGVARDESGSLWVCQLFGG
jgi:uncharacterized protein YkwD